MKAFAFAALSSMKAFSPIADFSYDYQDLLFTPVKESP